MTFRQRIALMVAVLTVSMCFGVRPSASLDAPVVPAVTVGDARVVEGSALDRHVLLFPITLSQPTDVPATLTFATVDGSARGGIAPTTPAGPDYRQSRATQISIPPGETDGLLRIRVWGDRVVEGDETMSVVVVAALGATAGGATATGTIFNDDSPGARLLVHSDAQHKDTAPLIPTVDCAMADPGGGPRRLVIFGFTRFGDIGTAESIRVVLHRGVYPDQRFDLDTPGIPLRTLTRVGQPGTFPFLGSDLTQPERHPHVFAVSTRSNTTVVWRLQYDVYVGDTDHGFDIPRSFRVSLRVTSPQQCPPGTPAQFATAKLDDVGLVEDVTDVQHDAAGNLTAVSLKLSVPGAVSNCSVGGTPLPPRVLYTFSDTANFDPLDPADIVFNDGTIRQTFVDTFAVTDVAARVERRIFGDVVAEIFNVSADVYGRCDFGGTIVTSALPEFVQYEPGKDTEWPAVLLNSSSQDPFAADLGPAGGGGIRFR